MTSLALMSTDQATAAPVNTAGRFAHVDALRALAIGLVVVAHAGADRIVPGGTGVTIFFAISGFVITWVTLREHDRTHAFSMGGFYRRRFWKLAPPLVVAIAVPSLVYALFRPFNWGAMVAQLGFYFNWFTITAGDPVHYLPGTGLVWSLAIEEQFYILFAVLWLLAVRSRHREALLLWGSAAVVLGSLALRVALADGLHADRIYYGTDTRADCIAFGILAAVLVHRGHTRWGRSSLVVIVALLLTFVSLGLRDDFFRDTLRYSLQAIAASTVVVYGFAATSGARFTRLFHGVAAWAPIQLVGRASYSIYLCHYQVIQDLSPWTDRIPVVGAPLGAVAGVGVGIALFSVLEIPVSRWQARRTGRGL